LHAAVKRDIAETVWQFGKQNARIAEAGNLKPM
jgi:hypothetical protein